MFNFKTHAKVAQKPYEVYHRDNPLGPTADDKVAIWEKSLPHRDGFEQTVTEDQITDEHEWKDKEKTQIMEKQLEASPDSKYITHRSDVSDLTMPPMNILVETIRQKRLADDYNVDKKPHWSHTFDEKKQQGSLPSWSKNAPQHDKIVLNNDPARFSASNDATAKQSIKPLIGDITTADVHKVADGIKEGHSIEYDNAILAILRLAHDEGRELTGIERNTVVNLKTARTKKLMQKNA